MSAVDIAQLAHAADECILCREGSDALFPNHWGGLVITGNNSAHHSGICQNMKFTNAQNDNMCHDSLCNVCLP